MDFEKVKTTYRENAPVQAKMAKSLISFLIKIKGKKFKSIFEIGAGTGFLTDEITNRLDFKRLILNDLTENLTGHIPEKYIKGDILSVDVPENMDLILSNAVFQWINDHSLLFSKLKTKVSQEGVVCFSYFGKENFRQIKDITGAGLLYPDLDDFIKSAGFKILFFEEELKTLCFRDAAEVLKHIKYTGVKTQNKIWTKNDFKHFEKEYLKNYRGDLGLELTYHPVYYILSI